MESIRYLDPDTFFAEIAVTEDAILIDVRPVSEIDTDPSVPGALVIDYINLSFDEKFDELDHLSQFYLYCNDGTLSQRAANHLISKGVFSVTLLKGGKQAWNKIKNYEKTE